MSQISAAIKATQTQIARLQSDVETLQQAVSIMGSGETAAPAKATPKSRKAKAKPTQKTTPKAKQKPQPKGQGKRHRWTAAEKAAIGKRMKAYWAKRKKASAPAAAPPAQPAPTQTRTRKPMSAAAKKALSKRMKASWAKRRKGQGVGPSVGVRRAGDGHSGRVGHYPRAFLSSSRTIARRRGISSHMTSTCSSIWPSQPAAGVEGVCRRNTEDARPGPGPAEHW